jgi:PAS domain S-box-containing protein
MADTLRVLYVDDDPDLLDIGKLFLEEGGQFSVDIQTSASTGLTLLKSTDYDAIISDYQMPGMDGIEFLKRVRTSGNLIPFILFTGRGREEVVIQALNEGADFYLQKGGEPVSQFTELAHKIRQAVQQRRAEASIRDHERREADIINFLPDATFAIDTNGVVIAWNRAMEEMTGVRTAEMLGKGNYEYSIPFYQERRPILIDLILQDDPAIAAQYPSLKRIGQSLVAEAISPNLYKGKGAAIWFSAAPLYNTQSEIVGAIESIRDITDRKKTEERERESSERYKSLITVSHTGAWEYHRDHDYLWCSPEYFSMLGRDIGQFDLSGAANLKETWIDLLHPEDRERASKHFTRYLDSGSPGIYENHFRMQHADGHWIWVWSRGQTLQDQNGILTNKTIGTHIDVTESKQAEKARRINNEHLNLAQEIGQTGSWELDFATGMIWASEETFRIFAVPYPADGIISLEEVETRIPDRERVHCALIDLIEKGDEYNLEYAIEPDDNSGQKIVHSVARILYDAEKKPVKIAGVIQDITGSKRAEKALRKSEKKFRLIIENSHDILYTLTTKGVFTFVSPAWTTLLGHPVTQVVGQPFQKFVHPDDIPGCMVFLKSVIETGQRQEGVEYRVQHTNGTWYWHTSSAVPFKNDAGTIVGFYGIARDITGRKLAEDALRESHQILDAIINTIPVRVFWKDKDLTFLGCNTEFARDAGFEKPEDVIGKDDYTMGWGEQAELYRADDRLVIESGKPKLLIEEPQTTPSGDQICLLTSKVPLKDTNGEIIGVLGTYLDITERKRAEKALQHQSAMLSILNEIISTTNKADDLPQLLESILTESMRLLDFDAGGIYLVDRSTQTANVVHSKNLPKEFLAEIRSVSIDKKPYDTLFIKNEPIITENYAQFASDHTKKFGFQSMASIPLLSKGVAIGALNIASRRRQVISDEEKQVLISISRELGSTIERMTAEEEAKKTAKDFETLFNSIDEMVFVLDMQGRILAVNDTVINRLLYTSEELTGMDILLLHVPERRDEALRIVQEMIAGTMDSCPVPVLAKDGTRIEVETRVTRGLWNNQEVLIGVSRDVTERKRAEEALQESEEKYRALFAAESDAIFVVDKETGIIIDCNDAVTPMYGYLRDEVIGQPNTAISAEPDATRAATKEVNDLIPIRYHKRKDGSIFAVEITANVIPVKGRAVIVAAVRDITERMRAEAALALTSKKLTLLSGITRHDINNQLAVLQGYLNILKKKQPDPSLSEYFNKTATAAQRIASMIQFTKEYEKIGVNAPVWQDCHTLVDTAAKQAPLGQVMVTNDLPAGAEVFTDPLVVKVFYNLMDNAVRYGGKITTIRFSVEEAGDCHLIVCDDDGDGVVAEEKEMIFERGFGKNTGMGLYLSREILAITGITIRETGEPGKGARFEIVVPKGAYRCVVTSISD